MARDRPWPCLGQQAQPLAANMLTGFFCKSSELGCAFSTLKCSQVVIVLIMSSSHRLTVPAEESTPLISLSSPDFQGKPRPHQHSDE